MCLDAYASSTHVGRPDGSGRYATAAVGCLLALGLSPTATAQTVGYSSSVYAAGSTYEGQQTTSFYVYQGVDMSAGRVRLMASVPLIRQRVESETGDEAVPEQTNTGFGDPLIRADVQLIDDLERGVQVTVAASVEPGMVEAADGLGTGETDYGVGASVFQARGRTSVFADAQFWKYGDPDGIDFENALAYSAGLWRILGSGRWSASISFAGFSPAGGAAAPLFVNVGVMALTGRTHSLAITAGFGLTETASDFSIGTSWRIQG